MPKHLLFICYWSVSDNLTIATVLPHLKVLQSRDDIERIRLVTIERTKMDTSAAAYLLPLSKVSHHLFQSGKQDGNLLEKVTDFVQLPGWLVRLSRQYGIDTVVAHGTPSGALAYKVWKRTKLPFYVSLFEPHAQYMIESGVWNKYGLKYQYQARWERKQIAHAAGLMPVTENYATFLKSKSLESKRVFTVPCTVHNRKFSYDYSSRVKLREKLRFKDAIVGLYAGKYEGLYYNDEAFLIYQTCFDVIPNFGLIILTPQPIAPIQEQLLKYKINPQKVYLGCVPNEQVSEYLSAADFAFATYKPGSSKKYLSPVKIGEYWANGLPVLLTEGVGDDSDIIKREGGGALFDLQREESLEQAIQQIQQIMKDPDHRLQIPKLAQKYRSPDHIQEAYDHFFGKPETAL